jgi:hypothetical protein
MNSLGGLAGRPLVGCNIAAITQALRAGQSPVAHAWLPKNGSAMNTHRQPVRSALIEYPAVPAHSAPQAGALIACRSAALPVDFGILTNSATGLEWIPSPPDLHTMTPATRREKIEALLADDPRDAFLRYSLALELVKEGSPDRGLPLLDELMRETPAYVPAFFQSGQILAGLGRMDAARTSLRAGIEAARAAGDAHAAGEMAEFLASIGRE